MKGRHSLGHPREGEFVSLITGCYHKKKFLENICDSIMQVKAQEILDNPKELEYDSETGQPAIRTRQVRN